MRKRREVRESQTSGVGPSQRSRFLVLTKRSEASGDKNNEDREREKTFQSRSDENERNENILKPVLHSKSNTPCNLQKNSLYSIPLNWPVSPSFSARKRTKHDS